MLWLQTVANGMMKEKHILPVLRQKFLLDPAGGLS
jgi:hypothetical protein